jgi:hypothetical protein
MSSTFKFHSQINETVPWQAQYSFPTQSTKVQKQTVKLIPKNGSSFSGGQIIRIELPADGYLNVLNSVVIFDLAVTSVTQARLQRGGAHNVIKRLKVMYGSLVIEDIQEYKTLVRIFNEAAVQQDYATSSGSILDGMYDVFEIAPGQSTAELVTSDSTTAHSIKNAVVAAKELSAVTRTYAISLLSGLLSSKKLLPLKWMAAQLSIEITLSEFADAFMTDNAAAETAYTMTNVSYLAEMIEFDSAYDSAFYAGLSQGVPIKFDSWHYHSFNLVGTTNQLQIHERSRSVKEAFAVIRSSDPANARNDTDIFFHDTGITQAGTGVIAAGTTAKVNEYQWRVGGRYYPSQPVRCTNGGAEAYLELMKCMDSVGDYSRASNINYLNWAPPSGLQGQKFIMCAEFENTDVMPDSIAGINAEEQSDINLSVTLAAAPTSKKLEVFMHYDALLIVREGNLVDLVM